MQLRLKTLKKRERRLYRPRGKVIDEENRFGVFCLLLNPFRMINLIYSIPIDISFY